METKSISYHPSPRYFAHFSINKQVQTLQQRSQSNVKLDDFKFESDDEKIDFDEVLQRQLGVMDLTAITLCRENNMPVRVFALRSSGALGRILRGEQEGTLVSAAG